MSAFSPPLQGPSPRRREDLRRLEETYGSPRTLSIEFPLGREEFQILRQSKKDGRFRDATLLIPVAGRLVCIEKHGYPEGIARPPSGGVVPGEPLGSAAVREAWEETGLRVTLERYLLRVSVLFTLDLTLPPLPLPFAEVGNPERFFSTPPPEPGSSEYWETHVFLARPLGGEVPEVLRPHDTREIRLVRLVSPEELEESIHPRMLSSGVGGFVFRVFVQEEALKEARGLGLL